MNLIQTSSWANASRVCRMALCAVIFVVFASSCSIAEIKTWTTDTFEEFRQGNLQDGGENTYVARDGSVRLIKAWDFNGDGNFDIPVTCPQNYTETPDLFVYWSGKDGYSAQRRTALPAEGCVAGTAADLNKDGYPELIVCNRFDGEKDNLDSYIYWGGKDGLSATRRTALPTEAAEGAAVADLNEDGYPDIVFANAGADYHMRLDNRQNSYVYLGSKNGYAASKRLELPTVFATAVFLADVNGDNHTDIIFSMEGNKSDDGGAVIYFNDGKGSYSVKRRTFLPGLASSFVTVAELNGDGYPDIVLVNRCKIKEIPTDYPFASGAPEVVETTDVNSYVYWGDKNGYSITRRAELPASNASSCAVDDLNSDKLQDIVFTGSVAKGSSTKSALIYWNSSQGFSASRQTEIEAPSARDCAAEDLNGDGYVDLVLANLESNGSMNTDSYIYWGGKDGLSSERRTSLPTHGASGIVLCDFNGDGLKDIAFMNKREGGLNKEVYVYSGDDSGSFSPNRRWILPPSTADVFVTADFNADTYADLLYLYDPWPIYWGGANGLSSNNASKLEKPLPAYTARAADLNRDGFLDLAMAGEVGKTSVLYGTADGFNSSQPQVIDERAVRSGYLQIADLNGDGWLDVIATVTADNTLMIIWNSEAGFSPQHKSTIKMVNSDGIRIADLNRDGYLDIIAISEFTPGRLPQGNHRPFMGGDPNTDMCIFWGSKRGYSDSRSTKLPIMCADDCTIADLNSDGWLDIATTSYHAGDNRHHPGYIYYNGPKGFDEHRRDLLEMNSGCGIFAADLNNDTFQDLVFANHCIVGDHRSYVSVVYGSTNGLRQAEAVKLPAQGPHYLNCADIGNVYDRSARYDYVSPAFDAGADVRLDHLSWEADTPRGTKVEFQIRSASTREDIEKANWAGPTDKGDYYTQTGATIADRTSGHRWIQFKASLVSQNSACSPVLRSVSLYYAGDN